MQGKCPTRCPSCVDAQTLSSPSARCAARSWAGRSGMLHCWHLSLHSEVCRHILSVHVRGAAPIKCHWLGRDPETPDCRALRGQTHREASAGKHHPVPYWGHRVQREGVKGDCGGTAPLLEAVGDISGARLHPQRPTGQGASRAHQELSPTGSRSKGAGQAPTSRAPCGVFLDLRNHVGGSVWR